MPMKKLIIALIYFGTFLPSKAQHTVYYFRDSNKQFHSKDLDKIPFKTFDKSTLNFGKDSSNHWFKIKITNSSSSNVKYFIEFGFPWFDSISFFSGDKQLIKNYSWATPLSQRLFEHQNFILPVLIRANSDTSVYCEFFKKTMLISGNISVLKEESFINNRSFNYSFFGIFGGIIITVSLFSFFLFTVSKENIYLYFCLYSLLYLVFNLTVQGYFLPWYQKGFGIVSANEFSSWVLWLSQMAQIIFIREFLWHKVAMPKWLKVTWKITLLLMYSIIFLKIIWIALLAKFHVVPNFLLLLISFCFLSSVITGFLLAIVATFKNINRTASLSYFIGIIPFFVLSVFSYGRNMGLIKDHWLLSQHTQVFCLAFDILVLMIGLGFRYKQLRDEKDRQTQMAIASKIKLLQEKERISRDLHDSVGSQLTVISTSLDNASYQAEKHILKPEKINQIRESVGDAVQSLRDSIWATHQSEINIENFSQRLKTYCSKLSNTDIAVSIHLSEKNITINALTALCLFRILQECIQNTLKHAHATQITITGNFENQIGNLSIADNGVGFEVEELILKENFGMENMKKRIEEIDGSLQIVSHKKQGTSIRLSFPI